MRERRVEVLIPHRDRAAGLARTLDSLRSQSRPAAVCVVDNDSSDGTIEMLAHRYPEVRVVELDRNLGFGAALNRGIAGSAADLVALINNDAVADPAFVELLVAEAERTGADMVAGCLRSPAGPVESLGVEVDRSLTTYDVGHGLADPSLYDGPPPLGPSGGAALFDRAAFERVGGFDEGFFAYLEDVALAIRMRLAGARCGLAAGAVAWHEHSGTLGARSDAKNELLGFSRGRLLWKYGSSLTASERLRGQATDAIVYAGKAVIDRNLGSVRGRLRARREHRGRRRPGPEAAFRDLPVADLGLRESLGRRLGRRR
jgi:N-acetylglucosaminyl-diphospho-decaprenol L-rhamnosyltransferase